MRLTWCCEYVRCKGGRVGRVPDRIVFGWGRCRGRPSDFFALNPLPSLSPFFPYSKEQHTMAQQPDQIDSRIVDLPGGKGRASWLLFPCFLQGRTACRWRRRWRAHPYPPSPLFLFLRHLNRYPVHRRHQGRHRAVRSSVPLPAVLSSADAGRWTPFEGRPRALTSCSLLSLSRLNRLVRETGAVACIHTGDFGFYEAQSIERISDKYVVL